MFTGKKLPAVLLGIVLIFLSAAVCLSRGAALPAFSEAEQGRAVYVLDAGHGGEDGGAVSAEGCKESDINLAITLRLEALLRFLGEGTVLTRADDVSVYSEGADTLHQKKVSDLKNRVALVNATPDAVLVSIHQNSLPSAPSVRGAQVFHGKVPGGETLALSVQTALNGSVNQGIEKQQKQIDSSIYLMKHVTGPAVLVECGFLSNEEEAALLPQPAHQTRLAVSIAAGILNAESGNVIAPQGNTA